MPYQTAQTDFERHYGEVVIDGKHHHYVKRRIENGVLVLKCLPNKAKEELTKAESTVFRLLNGIEQENGKNGSPLLKIFKSFQADFDTQRLAFADVARDEITTSYQSTEEPGIVRGYVTASEQPPDALRMI